MQSLTGCVLLKLFLVLSFCCYRAEVPPTLNDYNRRWSFKSGTESISVTVKPSYFIGEIFISHMYFSVVNVSLCDSNIC